MTRTKRFLAGAFIAAAVAAGTATPALADMHATGDTSTGTITSVGTDDMHATLVGTDDMHAT